MGSVHCVPPGGDCSHPVDERTPILFSLTCLVVQIRDGDVLPDNWSIQMGMGATFTWVPRMGAMPRMGATWVPRTDLLICHIISWVPRTDLLICHII